MKCYDHKTGQHVAVKIIRNKKRFHHQALVEVRILEHIREHVRPLPLCFCLFSFCSVSVLFLLLLLPVVLLCCFVCCREPPDNRRFLFTSDGVRKSVVIVYQTHLSVCALSVVCVLRLCVLLLCLHTSLHTHTRQTYTHAHSRMH